MNKKPIAYCMLKGSRDDSDLRGLVLFYEMDDLNLVKISITGFPVSSERCKQSIVAIHIHEGDSCTGTRENPFVNAKGHYNPLNCIHPYHAGDLGNMMINKDGSAFLSMTSDRFKISNIIGKTIILYQNLDDFTTQPAGNSGNRIACGIIKKINR